jgi:glutaredoxin
VPFEYIDVTKDAGSLDRMLRYTKDLKLVPVIVTGGRAEIGYDGGS